MHPCSLPTLAWNCSAGGSPQPKGSLARINRNLALMSWCSGVQGETDAEMLQQAVEHAQASAQVHSLAPLVQRINHSQHWWQARAAAAPEVALLTAGEGNAPGGPVGRPAPEELMSADTREELLAAQILAAVRGLAGT
jgi:hypothetical protein